MKTLKLCNSVKVFHMPMLASAAVRLQFLYCNKLFFWYKALPQNQACKSYFYLTNLFLRKMHTAVCKWITKKLLIWDKTIFIAYSVTKHIAFCKSVSLLLSKAAQTIWPSYKVQRWDLLNAPTRTGGPSGSPLQKIDTCMKAAGRHNSPESSANPWLYTEDLNFHLRLSLGFCKELLWQVCLTNRELFLSLPSPQQNKTIYFCRTVPKMKSLLLHPCSCKSLNSAVQWSYFHSSQVGVIEIFKKHV